MVADDQPRYFGAPDLLKGEKLFLRSQATGM